MTTYADQAAATQEEYRIILRLNTLERYANAGLLSTRDVLEAESLLKRQAELQEIFKQPIE